MHIVKLVISRSCNEALKCGHVDVRIVGGKFRVFSTPACCRITGSVASSAKMTNADVIDLVGFGLSDDVVIDKIFATKVTDFDTSISGLKALKAAKVSNAVIRAMINPQPGPRCRFGRCSHATTACRSESRRFATSSTTRCYSTAAAISFHRWEDAYLRYGSPDQ